MNIKRVKYAKTMIIKIVNAEYVGDYSLKIYFHDGKVNIVDFKSFLSNAKNPMIRKYLNIDFFKNFNINYGDLEWNDFELCFPNYDLYKGKI